jgi:hypothetical protein
MPAVYMLAALGLGLLLVWVSLPLGMDRFFTPPPEQAAANFVNALSAHRFSGAREQLSADLKEQLSPEDLKSQYAQIERQRSGILDVQELDSQEDGDHAQARLRVKLGDWTQRTIVAPLVRQNWVWKVAGVRWVVEAE